jgi:hypothetical protein
LPDFVRIAADVGVKEVYLQRLVFFDEGAIGLARLMVRGLAGEVRRRAARRFEQPLAVRVQGG